MACSIAYEHVRGDISRYRTSFLLMLFWALSVAQATIVINRYVGRQEFLLYIEFIAREDLRHIFSNFVLFCDYLNLMLVVWGLTITEVVDVVIVWRVEFFFLIYYIRS